MTYEEALAQVKGQETAPNYLEIQIHYDLTLILPYQQGMELIKSLEKAEGLKQPYNGPPQFQGPENVQFKVISAEHYQQLKMAELLQVPLETVKGMAKPNSPPF